MSDSIPKQPAMKIVVEEVAVEFDGEDPAVPDVRHMLDHTTERLTCPRTRRPTWSRSSCQSQARRTWRRCAGWWSAKWRRPSETCPLPLRVLQGDHRGAASTI